VPLAYQVPPREVSERVIQEPIQIGIFPVIGPGVPLTVTTVVVNPQAVVKVTVDRPAVLPGVTTPVGVMTAVPTVPPLHVPAHAVIFKVSEDPLVQTGVLPVMDEDDGAADTVMAIQAAGAHPVL